jgi:uncharacterized protein (TIGR00297 family)
VRLPTQQTWQSWLVLAVTIPWCLLAALRYVVSTSGGLGNFGTALAISVALALLVILLRAATPAAALTGGILTFAITLGPSPWYRSGFPALLTVSALTFGATRFGRARKQQLGVAESRRGRGAAQIAANLGAASVVASLALLEPGQSRAQEFLVAAVVASLAEAAADTLASELGEVLGGQPFLLTTFRQVTPGTDGAISWAGTAAGVCGAAVIVLVASLTLRPTAKQCLAAGIGGIAGLFVDSLLGATVERGGWLNNDAVNFLSTVAAAVVSIGALFCIANVF